MVNGIVNGDIVKITTTTPRVTYHLFKRKKLDKSLAILCASDLKAPNRTATKFNQQ